MLNMLSFEDLARVAFEIILDFPMKSSLNELVLLLVIHESNFINLHHLMPVIMS